MATREMTAEEAKQELEIAHTALIGTVEELQGHGLHSATIVEALIALAVQVAVRDWGREEPKAILNDALKARLLPRQVWLKSQIISRHPQEPIQVSTGQGVAFAAVTASALITKHWRTTLPGQTLWGSFCRAQLGDFRH